MAVDTDQLKLDFRPADFGDAAPTFQKRLNSVTERAEARQDATDEQHTQHARALLIGMQIRELLRKSEEFTAVGEVSIRQGLAERVAALKREEQACILASGLPVPGSRARPTSVSVETLAGF